MKRSVQLLILVVLSSLVVGAQAKTTVVACEGLGFGAYIQRGLLAPASSAKKFDVIVNNWYSSCPALPNDGDIVVVMHSMGAGCFNCMRGAWAKRQIKRVLTLDPRVTGTPYVATKNVESWFNFYQKSLWLPGYVVDGAMNERVYVGHTSIPYLPVVKKRLEEVL